MEHDHSRNLETITGKERSDLEPNVSPTDLVAMYLGEIHAYKALTYAQTHPGIGVLEDLAGVYTILDQSLQERIDQISSRLQNAHQIEISNLKLVSQARQGDILSEEDALRATWNTTYLLEYATIVRQFGGDATRLYARAMEEAISERASRNMPKKIVDSLLEQGSDITATVDTLKEKASTTTEAKDALIRLLLRSGRIEDAQYFMAQVSGHPLDHQRFLDSLSPEFILGYCKQGDLSKALDVLNQTQTDEFNTLENVLLQIDIDSPYINDLWARFDDCYTTACSKHKHPGYLLARKAEVSARLGFDIESLLTEAALLAFDEPNMDNLNNLMEIITLAIKQGIPTNHYAQQIVASVDKMIAKIDFTDKLDPIEGVMTYEEITKELIKNGFINEGIELIEKYHSLFPSKNGEQYTEEGFVAEISALLAAKLLGMAHQPQEGRSSLKFSSDQLLRAVGYFNIKVDKESIDSNTELEINIGRYQRRMVDNDLSAKQTAFNEVEIKPESSPSANLLSELLGEADPTDMRRAVKELLEIGGPEITQIATDLFLDQTQPTRFRTYLAKKLCDNGVWDRQILYYFRDYKNEAKSINAERDKLETLETIITEMHQAPNLRMYKVLEKTRIHMDQGSMRQVAKLGSEIFLTDSLNLSTRLDIFSYWAEKFISGEISDAQLIALTSDINSLGQTAHGFIKNEARRDSHREVLSAIEALLKSHLLLGNEQTIQILLANKIFPTPWLLAYLKTFDQVPIEQLLSLLQETKEGNFDPTNLVQRNLEFVKYLRLNGYGVYQELGEDFDGFKDFDKVPFVDRTKEIKLSYHELAEAEVAAYECAHIYWFVNQLVDEGRNVIVVGNKRYGQYFVTEPLSTYFSKLNVSTYELYLRSSGIKSEEIPVLPDYFIRILSQQAPDIVIVDGSPNVNHDHLRLPSSFKHYKRWFEAFNSCQTEESLKDSTLERLASFKPQSPYAISFWSPVDTDSIELAKEMLPKQAPDNSLPTAYFVNSVINPALLPEFPPSLAKHRPGFFDDPEHQIADKSEIVFTKYGIQDLGRKNSNEEEYVRIVQDEIERNLPKYIRLLDPSQNTSLSKSGDVYRAK